MPPSDRPMTDAPAPQPSLWKALTHGRTLFTLVMFAIFAVMVYIATGYPPAARLLPLVIGIPGAVLSLLQVALDVRDFFRVRGRIDPRTDFERYMDEMSERTGGEVKIEVPEGTQLQTLVEDPTLLARSRNKREILLFAYFFLLIALVLLFGFWIGYPIFLAIFLRFYARESWKLTAALTAGSWTAMYLVLAVVLQQLLFEGFVTQYVVNTWLSD